MEQLIKMERLPVDLKALSTEELTFQANDYWLRTEMLGQMGIAMMAEAGKRLIEIKSRVKHGEWENWAKSNLRFSVRKANRMMTLAQKIEGDEGIFSNPTILADLSISKVYEVLSAPDEVAETVVEEARKNEMTTEEFKSRLKEMTRKYEDLKEELHEKKELEKQVGELKKEIELTASKNLEGKLREKELELAELKKGMREKLKAAKEKAEKEAEEQAGKHNEEVIKKAVQDASEEKELKIRGLQAENERLRKMTDPDIVQFKMLADQLQQVFGNMNEIMMRQTDIGQQEKMRKAMSAILARMEDLSGNM